MTRIGDLVDRLTFQENIGTKKPGGAMAELWVNRGERWGAIKPLGVSKQLLAMSAKSVATHTITIHSEAGISTAWRIVDGARLFEVLGVQLVGDSRQWMEFLVSEIQS